MLLMSLPFHYFGPSLFDYVSVFTNDIYFRLKLYSCVCLLIHIYIKHFLSELDGLDLWL